MPDISDLLKEAANVFAQLATAYEEEQRSTRARLDHIEYKTAENREALKAAAEAILKNLN
jgi:hypothetical protein